MPYWNTDEEAGGVGRLYCLVGLIVYKRPHSARLARQSTGMASRGKPAERVLPRLYLVTPPDHSGLADALSQALDRADIAAVLLRLPNGEHSPQFERIKALAGTVQGKGAALILEGRPDLAASAGLDGAHLDGVDQLKAALPMLKPERIAGCGGLTSRHAAMLAGEAGADYVMFGEPASTGARAAFHAISERIAWWAELFEIPCVGFAGSLDEVEPLAAAGADFVALGECVFADSRGCAVAVAEAARRIGIAEAQA